mgnify:CR=1 FL=1
MQEQAEHMRYVSARMVRTVAQILASFSGCWLDVGCGNGSLLTTAAEFGFDACGIDTRSEPVDALTALGYSCLCVDFEFFDAPAESFHVVSMCDVLEHMPFPRRALAKVHRLLAPQGLVFLSMPNRDCLAWKLMDQNGTNPYWGELEHYHNFDRAGLYRLLQEHGLMPVYYGVSERYRAAMEVVAVKVGPLPPTATVDPAVAQPASVPPLSPASPLAVPATPPPPSLSDQALTTPTPPPEPYALQ